MASESSNYLDNQIKEAELKRLQAETLRIEAERRSYEKIATLPFYKSKVFFQSIVAGLVAVPLIWFYVTDVAVPLYESQNVKLARDIALSADSLKQDRENFRKKEQELKKQIYLLEEAQGKYVANLNQLKKEYENLINEKKKLAGNYQTLLQKPGTSSQQQKTFKQRQSALQIQLQNTQSRVRDLDQEIKRKENLLRSIPQELNEAETGKMLKHLDFYCTNQEWTKKFANPNGRGFQNLYKLTKHAQVIYDAASGLMWRQPDPANKMGYENTENYIKQLNDKQFAGYSDWRLPTLEEAMSLMEPQKNKRDLYIDPLFDKAQLLIWTADRFHGSSVWIVNFDFGSCDRSDELVRAYVQAVRSEQ